MSVLIVLKPATAEEIESMLSTLQVYIKLAVDIEKKILAGGGEMHADCERKLLETGSLQRNIWGADWNPETQEVTYESLINIRPSQNNRSMVISDLGIRCKIEAIVRHLLEIK
ncbi:DUF5674 family protein [Oscillatoria sp. FACHB-1406]|uniref:DUF5674 family protein n=1 Tax=Oscillatoria sp. FACHB-1406 TaxID=2692846 RepID=UPI0016856FF5|nr:DUF5674 family protein [Oscillatoria sp. FACHB-1406]MBD2576776.1 hypothetical protein [Oscillatoria sp. FACHB-1406]